jgi:predicted restriction endonuclease
MYNCQLCEYKTRNKSQIASHHIKPRSLGGNNKAYNLIFLCPTCHTKIFVPNVVCGIHSMKHDNSIIIHGKMLSTGGMVLSYSDIDSDEIKYTLLK